MGGSKLQSHDNPTGAVPCRMPQEEGKWRGQREDWASSHKWTEPPLMNHTAHEDCGKCPVQGHKQEGTEARECMVGLGTEAALGVGGTRAGWGLLVGNGARE